MIRNVMIAAIVQRPNIPDILEIRSNKSSAICYRLEVVKFKMLYLRAQLDSETIWR